MTDGRSRKEKAGVGRLSPGQMCVFTLGSGSGLRVSACVRLCISAGEQLHKETSISSRMAEAGCGPPDG